MKIGLNQAVSVDLKEIGGKSAKGSEQADVGKKSFMDHLTEKIVEVNEQQKSADVMGRDLTIGKTENLHETMLATTQAELSFNLMVQVRNKALEAYQEVMRMPI